MNTKHYGFIYMTTNLINGKLYIGMHKGSENDDYLGSGTLITKSIKKFNTIGLALQFLNLKGHIQLNNAIKNKTLYKGFYWSRNIIGEV